MKKFNLFFLILLLTFAAASANAFSTAPKETPQTRDQTQRDPAAKDDAPQTNSNNPDRFTDSLKKAQLEKQTNPQSGLQIDTVINNTPIQTTIQEDTVTRPDSTLVPEISENALTNTKLFIYILLSVIGLALFFYIFVITLFKTFHKKKSTRQSLLLSWNLFFIVTIIWIFIIWGLVAGFWTAASFMIVVIFLFIISLIMTIIAVKSK
ncbi:MAG: hypothetical protein KBF96_01720 [Ignavibacteria bacterium]|nr:hypothetical protein [Ignavibacteria bacterium]